MVFVYVGCFFCVWDGRSVYVYVLYVCFKGIGVYVAFFHLLMKEIYMFMFVVWRMIRYFEKVWIFELNIFYQKLYQMFLLSFLYISNSELLRSYLLFIYMSVP